MTVREREDEIRRLLFETAVAWNADGVEVLTKTGEKNRIVFSDEELVLLQGCVFTHNHPGGLAFPENDPRSFGNSFSLSDIRLACFVSLIELRAVTPRLRFSLKPSASVWNADYWQQMLEPIYIRRKAAVSQEIRSALKSGRLGEAEAGLFYQREEN